MAADPHNYRVEYQDHGKESPEEKVARLAGALSRLNQEASTGRFPPKGAPVVLANRDGGTASFMNYQDNMRQKAFNGGGASLPPPPPLQQAEDNGQWGPPREQQIKQVHSLKKAFVNARTNPNAVRQQQEQQHQERMMYQMMQEQASKGEMKMVYFFLGALAIGGLAYWGYTTWVDSADKAVQLARMQALYAQLPPAAPVLPGA